MTGWFGTAMQAAVADGTGLAVTGAGSWLGQALLATLVQEGQLPVRLRLFASADRTVRIGDHTLPVEALAGAPPLSGRDWLVLHFAFLGKERAQELAASDFVNTNRSILEETLRIIAPAQRVRLVFASSGAVYGPDGALTEDRDTNPYGWCKAKHERALGAWCAARGVPLVIPRIFSIGGPGVTKEEGYALTSFILSARRAGVIRILAQRPVFRSYVHVAELNALLCEAVLAHPAGAPLVFDTAGLETLEMNDLAAAVAHHLAPVQVQIERLGLLCGEAEWYIGNGATYRGLIARSGGRVVGIGGIIADTTAALASLTAMRGQEDGE